MGRRVAAAAFGAALAAGTAASAGPFDDLFFVRVDPSAEAMLADRGACAKAALELDIDSSRGFSNADYGVLTAMGSAMQQDGADGKVRKAVRRAVVIKCMERRGWTEADVPEGEVKALKKAADKDHPKLDAWLKANAAPPPAPKPAASTPVAADAPPKPPAEPAGPADAPAPPQT